MKRYLKFILISIFILLQLNSFSHSRITYGLFGASYIYESHFGDYLQGFELNFNIHTSGCRESHYNMSFGVNMLNNKNFNEYGISYTAPFLGDLTSKGHTIWNLIYKINPNYISGLGENTFMIKPGIGICAYTGVRTFPVCIQVFAIYNYDIFLQKDQNLNKMSNHSIQIGANFGFKICYIKKRRKPTTKSKENSANN